MAQQLMRRWCTAAHGLRPVVHVVGEALKEKNSVRRGGEGRRVQAKVGGRGKSGIQTVVCWKLLLVEATRRSLNG